ncbi:MAG: hypothetical protein ACK48R_17815 [Planctomyces sp.]
MTRRPWMEGTGSGMFRGGIAAALLLLILSAEVYGQATDSQSAAGAGAAGAGTAAEQVEASARRAAPPSMSGRQRRLASRSVGTAGRRAGLTPNIAGDMLGFTNQQQFVATGPMFQPQSLFIRGGGMSDLFAERITADVFRVDIPGSSAGGGQANGGSVGLLFNVDGQLLNYDGLTSAERGVVADLVSRTGSAGAAGYTGTVSESSLRDLRANLSGGQSAGSGLADLSLGVQDGFYRGGFAEGQSLALSRAGSQISQYKISEENSPLPRDRVFFNYNYFNSVVGSAGYGDVQRFVPGFERTFNDSWTSAEVRLPFAGTFDSAQLLNEELMTTGGSAAELGNLSVALKQLLLQTESGVVSGGLSVELPTADDTVIQNRALYMRRSGEAVTVAPWLGLLMTPTDRTFIQGFGQVAFDTTGEAVLVEDRYSGESAAGRLQESAVLYASVQGGVWLYQADAAADVTLTGLAGVLELHFNEMLQSADYFSANVGGVPLEFGNAGSRANVVNLTTGLTAQLYRRTNLTMSVVVPTSSDRQFDSELHIGLNHYFGPGGRRSSGMSR